MNELKSLALAGFFKKDTRTLVEAAEYTVKKTTDHAPLSVELAMLLEREKIGLLKNPAAVIINFMITAFLGLVFGVIFYGVGQADRSDPTVVQSQLGALINIMISTMMGQSQVALSTFPTERPMFVREYSTRHYSVLTYFVSRLTTEAVQTFLATLLQALVVFWMIGFQQSFWAFLATSFSLAMTSTAVSVLLGSFFSDEEAARSTFTVRYDHVPLPPRRSNQSSFSWSLCRKCTFLACSLPSPSFQLGFAGPNTCALSHIRLVSRWRTNLSIVQQALRR